MCNEARFGLQMGFALGQISNQMRYMQMQSCMMRRGMPPQGYIPGVMTEIPSIFPPIGMPGGMYPVPGMPAPIYPGVDPRLSNTGVMGGSAMYGQPSIYSQPPMYAQPQRGNIWGEGATPVEKGANVGRMISDLQRTGRQDVLANSNVEYMNYDQNTQKLSLDSGLAYSKESLKSLDKNGDGQVNIQEAGPLGEVIDINQDAQSYAKLIEENIPVKIEFEDERLSSFEAERILIEQNIKPSRNKPMIDMAAASIVLQQYLNKRR